MNTGVFVIGAGMTRFGELWGASPRSLAREAVGAAMAEAGVAVKDIDGLFVGNMLSGMLGGQEHLGALFAEDLGLPVPAFKVEGACASGGLAMHAGVSALLSGQYKTVVVLGVEKMTDHKPEHVATALMGAGASEERAAGATFPGLYAMLARCHMEEYGTTPEHLAAVAVKNHVHSALNPNAQFRNKLTAEAVLRSSLVADPLRLLDCSPITDGAAAVVLTTRRRSGVAVAASVVATDTLGLAHRSSLTSLPATRHAAKKAYTLSGIGPTDIDVAEVHDCFTIAEILAMEDLGLFAKGKAAAAIAAGETTISSATRTVVNTSGGLKGCGHPVGATGVKQIVELYQQLTGKAGARQVAGARIGLAQNVGGSGATAVVHVLMKGKGSQ